MKPKNRIKGSVAFELFDKGSVGGKVFFNKKEKEHHYHKCLRCPALISLRAKYCMPCSDDVRREHNRSI